MTEPLTDLVQMIREHYGVGETGLCACKECQLKRNLTLVQSIRKKYRVGGAA